MSAKRGIPVVELGEALTKFTPGENGNVVSQSRPRRTQATSSAAEIDWRLVVELRKEASEKISQSLENRSEGKELDEDDRQMLGRAVIRQVVRNYAEQLSTSGQQLWPLALERRYAVAVENAIFGYGRLQPLFEIPDAENIEIHGCDSVIVQYSDGRRVEHPRVADSDEELIEAIRFFGVNANPPRAFDDAHPMMTVAVGKESGDQFRIHAIGFGLSYRPSIVIRHHILTSVTLDDLAERQMMSQRIANFLRQAVLGRKSIVISGDQGAGKTTLLRALIDAIPETERFGTIETDYELLTHLQPGRKNMLALQAKTGLGELVEGRRLGEYSVADLVPEALRQNLSRLVIGEVRGSEAGAMFEAMQIGTGCLSTTHSHSASSTMDRLATRVASGDALSLDQAFRQIALNLHLLVHVTLVDDTWRGGLRKRFVSEVRALTGAIEGGRPVTHLVYQASADGRPELFDPPVSLMSELARYRAA